MSASVTLSAAALIGLAEPSIRGHKNGPASCPSRPFCGLVRAVEGPV